MILDKDKKYRCNRRVRLVMSFELQRERKRMVDIIQSRVYI